MKLGNVLWSFQKTGDRKLQGCKKPMLGCAKTLRKKLSKAHAGLASDAGPLIDRLIYEAGKAVVKPL